MTHLRSAAWIAAGASFLALAAIAGPVGNAVQEAASGNEQAAVVQDRIDTLSDDIEVLAADYRGALQQTRALRVYEKQLQRLVVSQREEITSMTAQIDNVTVVGRQVMPLMERMLDGLGHFVELDLPFLPDERARRLLHLRELMLRADVAISEKYRRILEAYQIENEYGRTIEAYRGKLEGGQNGRTVDFLRIGRVGLYYQTLDGEESGRWNPESKAWEELSGYRISIHEGIRIARKQTAPNLIEIPMPAPEAAQ